MGSLTRAQSSGRRWVLLAVICHTTLATIEPDSTAVQIQISPAAPGVTEYVGNNLIYVDIKDNSSTESDLWHKVLLQLSANASFTHTSLSDGKSRRRRYVFGKDNRVRVVKAQTYPFSTVVLLSVGCTGTLVGTKHVLTAAHCIHDGRKYLTNPRLIRIGILKGSEHFQWTRVETAFLPKQWKKALTNKQSLKYDFAILKLRKEHRRPVMALKPFNLKPGAKMQFAGFHGDKSFKSLWYSQCNVFKKTNGVVFNFCDGSKGVSGSGVYIETNTGLKNAVVGIVTAIGRGKVNGKELRFNIVNSLNRHKIRRISRWMTKD